MDAPKFMVREVGLYERPVVLRMPFRFGAVTMREAPQCFVRVRIEMADGSSHWGAAAEVLAPKWFDKDPLLSNEDNFEQLRLALRLAADAYTKPASPRSAFGHFAAHYPEQITAGAAHGLNPLVSCFGSAELDCAILDALCTGARCSFYEAMSANLPGVEPALLSDYLADLAGFDMCKFLSALQPTASIAARHTVGLLDPIIGHPGNIRDGLPESLQEVIAAYGNTYFKLKLGGALAADLERLSDIAALLDTLPAGYQVTLDGNEQYDSHGALLELWQRMRESPRLERLIASILFIEQPVSRAHALDRDVSELSGVKPVIIDESDQDLSAFPRARALGYAGVSSKCCKGPYKSVLNAARCAMWNAEGSGRRYFMSGEDLTTQAGLAVQQDLALVNLLGIQHVERNGHHYVNGLAGHPQPEQDEILKAHPDLYERSHGAVRLRIQKGRLGVASLAGVGFASGPYPDWIALQQIASVGAPA